LSVFDHVIRQKLQGDKAVEVYILGLINNPHATPTKLFGDPVGRDGLADYQTSPA